MKKTIVCALLGVAGMAGAQVCVFDSMTGQTTISDTGSTPRSMKGMAFSLGNVASGPVTITGMDFDLVNVSGTNSTFTSAEVDVSFWDIASNATSGATAAFTNRLATYSIGIAAGTYNSGFYYQFGGATPGTPGVTFSTPFTYTGITNLGVQILVRGDIGDGNGLVASNTLDMAVVLNGPTPAIGAWTAGTAGTFGFYRNASQATPTNPNTSLLGSDFRVFTGATNIGLPIRLYTTPVPEPASLAALGIGALALLRRRSRKA